jgi:hypothetical protein
VERNVLEKWKEDRQCRLFVISAIRPTRINVETILIEVDRLELTDIFMEDDANIRVVPHKYARKGNVIVCGYPCVEQ